MPERNYTASARGRVLDAFAIHNHGTAVVVDIIDGAWCSGSQLKDGYGIRSVEFIDGKDLPHTAIAFLIDDNLIGQSVVAGQEVWSVP